MADSVSVVHTKTPVVVIHNPSDRVVVVKVGNVISGGAVSNDGGSGVVVWTDILGKPTTFPPSAHNHDDRYYTEAEIDTKLSSKADTTALASKADSSTVTTLSATVAGKETPTGAQAKADAAQSAAQTYADNKVAALTKTIVLGASDPIPGGTPAGTVIVRLP